MRRVMPHVADGRMRLSAVMTHEFSLADYAEALRALSEAYEKLGRQARALRDFKRAVALKKAKLT